MLTSLFHIGFDNDRVFGAVTKRKGGVSKPPFDALNTGFQTGDLPQAIVRNRQLIFDQLPSSLHPFVFTYQSHSTVLKKVFLKDAGKGLHSFESGVEADALYTTDKQLPIGIFHADCVPIFLVHQSKSLIAIIHAGTPGTLQHIALKVVQSICKQENIKASELDAYLGPSLDFAHHPISVERMNEILSIDANFAPAIKLISGQLYVDVPLLNYMQLIDAGLSPTSIRVSTIDTFSNAKEYYSASRDAKTGRHLSFIYLK